MHSAAEHTPNTVGFRHEAAAVVRRAAAVEWNWPNSVGACCSRAESGRSRAGGGHTASEVAPAASNIA